jgi:hypothetical protein
VNVIDRALNVLNHAMQNATYACSDDDLMCALKACTEAWSLETPEEIDSIVRDETRKFKEKSLDVDAATLDDLHFATYDVAIV